MTDAREISERLRIGIPTSKPNILEFDAAEDLMNEAAVIIEQQSAEIEQLQLRVKELEGQHKGLVLNNAMLRERPDLPADRIPAAKAYEREIERLQTKLNWYRSYYANKTDIEAEIERLREGFEKIIAVYESNVAELTASTAYQIARRILEETKDE